MIPNASNTTKISLSVGMMFRVRKGTFHPLQSLVHSNVRRQGLANYISIWQTRVLKIPHKVSPLKFIPGITVSILFQLDNGYILTLAPVSKGRTT